jgi:hypothetical protein
VATVAKNGFETSYQFTVPKKGLWEFWVVAVNKELQPVGSSNRFRLLVGGLPVYFPLVQVE